MAEADVLRLGALVQAQGGSRDQFAGDPYILRGRRGDLCKIIWHDDVGMSLYAKRLERGKYIWPASKIEWTGL
jgi:transposase